MLVIGRKAADLLQKKNEPDMFSTFQIVVPASAADRVIEVRLCEIRAANGSARIGVVADRDIRVSRSELIKE
jgi:hypothetical protein